MFPAEALNTFKMSQSSETQLILLICEMETMDAAKIKLDSLYMVRVEDGVNIVVSIKQSTEAGS